MRKFVNRLVIPVLLLGALVFVGGRTTLADGGHHHGHHGRHDHHGHRSFYSGGGPGCYVPRYHAYGYHAYPVYPSYRVRSPYYGGQTSFYNRGPNYSFGFSYGW